MSLERIDKVLSHAGFGTRKAIKKLLRISTVTVNGKQISDSAFQVNTDTDKIFVDQKEVFVEKNIYLMMNKPSATVSANKDGLHRTVFDLLDEKYRTPWISENLHLIGRLDIDTEGLLVFTTDGSLTHKITSPKTHFPKEYFVRLSKNFSQEEQNSVSQKFKDGLYIPPEGNESEAFLKPAETVWNSSNECILTITEGKFHQVKRMFLAVNNEVIYLKRLSIGSLKLDENLKPGEYRPLTQSEINNISLKDERYVGS